MPSLRLCVSVVLRSYISHMFRLRRYASSLLAEQAAAYLRSRGVAARVVGHLVQDIAVFVPAYRGQGLELVILSDAQRDLARTLLDELETDPAQLDPDWEAGALPELSSAVFARHPIRCPACDADVSAHALDAVCRACAAPFDPLGLLVAQHGPEALADLYEHDAAAPPVSDDKRSLAALLPQPCKHCKHDLRALPARGRCPSCGALYDKTA